MRVMNLMKRNRIMRKMDSMILRMQLRMKPLLGEHSKKIKDLIWMMKRVTPIKLK
jgi:hypothetical protein